MKWLQLILKPFTDTLKNEEKIIDENHEVRSKLIRSVGNLILRRLKNSAHGGGRKWEIVGVYAVEHR